VKDPEQKKAAAVADMTAKLRSLDLLAPEIDAAPPIG
jgi:hypothetical protein